MLYFASLDNIAQQKLDRSSRPEVLGKAILEIYTKFTGEHTPMPKCDFNWNHTSA